MAMLKQKGKVGILDPNRYLGRVVGVDKFFSDYHVRVKIAPAQIGKVLPKENKIGYFLSDPQYVPEVGDHVEFHGGKVRPLAHEFFEVEDFAITPQPKKKIVPMGISPHLKGMAFDFIMFDDVAKAKESLGETLGFVKETENIVAPTAAYAVSTPTFKGDDKLAAAQAFMQKKIEEFALAAKPVSWTFKPDEVPLPESPERLMYYVAKRRLDMMYSSRRTKAQYSGFQRTCDSRTEIRCVRNHEYDTFEIIIRTEVTSAELHRMRGMRMTPLHDPGHQPVAKKKPKIALAKRKIKIWTPENCDG